MNENAMEGERNELWAIYSWWASVLILKMTSLTWFTGRIRVARQVIHSEEDRMWMEGANVILCPTGGGHPDVNRIRSAHYNDIAIVIPYLLIVPIWLNTSPSFLAARTIMLLFAISNISSTLLHMRMLEAPDICRTISSGCGLLILSYICVSCMSKYFDLH